MTHAHDIISLFHGEALFKAGQEATHIYLVETGAILVLNQAGDAIERFFGPNELFGIPELLGGASWDLTAIASGQTTIRAFPADTLFRSISEMPADHRDFIKTLASVA